ncbi:MAG TPA: glycoside hydrolase family 15 protein [Stellaceae bacterium]|nr:glycoside hydrolase family 15 protein [Stellaceae bacterium]
MSAAIEDYGIIGNSHTAALVGRDGSIDWLCLPRFDAEAVFAALLGETQNGRWLIAPVGPVTKNTRSYRGETGILETTFETDSGSATIIDFMPVPEADGQIELIRLIRGNTGRVRMHTEIILRFDYGRSIPWVRRRFGGLNAISGPHAVQLSSPVPLRGTPELTTIGEFEVAAGEIVPFSITWYPSHRKSLAFRDPVDALQSTENWWHDWTATCALGGPWREAIIRSLITLKMLTYEPTGGIVAAPTTSLPEFIGGSRNWDYRYCWLRDATLALYALMTAGYRNEARAWREWLLRSAAGHPSELQIMYGIAGERRLTELKLDWLRGYEGSRPVRIGNAAHRQLQIDVYGELMDTLFACNRFGLEANADAWDLQTQLLNFLEHTWDKPDHGIWETRGEPRHFTFSNIMAWVAFDRAVKSINQYDLKGPRERWEQLRAHIHDEVIAKGYDSERNSFVQYYGGSDLDASLLLIPQLGFLPPEDPRVVGTIEAIERELVVDGLVMRYTSHSGADGLPAGEGAFLVCTCWLANSLALIGRRADAVALFERLLALRNDLGLLSEEYDPQAKRFMGNFPQAFSHIGIINTAAHLALVEGASADRGAETAARSA